MDKGEIIIYQASNGTTNLEVRLEEETVWLVPQGQHTINRML
jgi:hypothetical protein